jgi:hypothetical protein
MELPKLPGEALADHFYFSDQALAEWAAQLIAHLAPATYAQHHALAEQLRAAAATAFAQPETGSADG